MRGLYLAWEEFRAGQLDVRFMSSADGGRSWTRPRLVNDDRSDTDQVQPRDPGQPVQRRGGLGQLACDAFDDPCTDIFIGDYFGLVVTPTRVAALSVSTAVPSSVLSESGQPIHYQQQLLATVERRDLGL